MHTYAYTHTYPGGFGLEDDDRRVVQLELHKLLLAPHHHFDKALEGGNGQIVHLDKSHFTG
jgi:hypothetical protein